MKTATEEGQVQATAVQATGQLIKVMIRNKHHYCIRYEFKKLRRPHGV